jgi:hypothetical protein
MAASFFGYRRLDVVEREVLRSPDPPSATILGRMAASSSRPVPQEVWAD